MPAAWLLLIFFPRFHLLDGKRKAVLAVSAAAVLGHLAISCFLWLLWEKNPYQVMEMITGSLWLRIYESAFADASGGSRLCCLPASPIKEESAAEKA